MKRIYRRLVTGSPASLAGRRLRRLVRHAYKYVDVYRKAFDEAGIQPAHIRTLADLQRLPLMSRQTLMDGYPEGIRARNVEPLSYHLVTTSGSTGAPLRMFLDDAAVSRLILTREDARHTSAAVPRRALVKTHAPNCIEGLVRAQVERLPPSAGIECFEALQAPEELAAQLWAFAPHLLYCYPSVLESLIGHSARTGTALPSPRLIVTSAESFPRAAKRRAEQAFRCPIRDCYVSTEAGGSIASQCRYGSYHISSRRVFLEIIDGCGRPVAPGVAGRVVLTNLQNFTTPIIRYAGLGDVAVLGEGTCRCGDRRPWLSRIEGRRHDAIRLPGGDLVHPFTITIAMERHRSVRRFKVVQAQDGVVTVYIVTDERGQAGERLSAEVGTALGTLLRAGLPIGVHVVESLPDQPAGAVRSLMTASTSGQLRRPGGPAGDRSTGPVQG